MTLPDLENEIRYANLGGVLEVVDGDPQSTKDMIRGLEEMVARRDVEADDRMAERTAEEALKVSQADAEKRRAEMIEVQKEWAGHHPFSLFGPVAPTTWQEMAQRMGEENKGMRAEKGRVEKERDEAREETK